MQICDETPPWLRVQLARVFRKYVSPLTPVEMLKRKRDMQAILTNFRANFRAIPQVQAAFLSRPMPDEVLCALLWEYKDRGKKGYDLTERFFSIFRAYFPQFIIEGPERAGKDIFLGDILNQYPNPRRPIDFFIYESNKRDVLVIGFARYDSDRGGAQEDDRPGQYSSAISEILTYCHANSLRTKILLLNDGPGLLLGTMWRDYIKLEESHPGEVIVATLRMIPERLTLSWLRSKIY
jgi:hypothetical protein